MNQTINGVLLVGILLGFLGCSSAYRGENRVQHGELIVTEGVFEDQEWNERLRFNRTSFYRGATLHYDILAARMSPDSSYRYWLEQDGDKLKECREFVVLLLYKNLRSPESHTEVMEQLTSERRTEVSLPSFKRHLEQHPLISQMYYDRYLVKGICDNELGNLQQLKISLAGFKQATLDIPSHE